MSVPDESYYVPDESYYVPDESYYVPDESYSRNDSLRFYFYSWIMKNV
jgi:hypothetical protein